MSDLPFLLRSAGRIILPPGRTKEQIGRPLVTVIWFVGGHGRLRRAGRPDVVVADQELALIMGPQQAFTWLAEGPQGLAWRWCTMDGPHLDCLQRLWSSREGTLAPCPHALFDQMADALAGEDALALRCATAAAFEVLLRANQPTTQDLPLAVQRVQACISGALDDPTLSPGWLARHLGRSTSGLSRQFRQATGGTIQACIRQRRLDLARQLLTTTSLSVAEVARRCGFIDATYFSRLVRQHCGRSPREVRKGGS